MVRQIACASGIGGFFWALRAPRQGVRPHLLNRFGQTPRFCSNLHRSGAADERRCDTDQICYCLFNHILHCVGADLCRPGTRAVSHAPRCHADARKRGIRRYRRHRCQARRSGPGRRADRLSSAGRHRGAMRPLCRHPDRSIFFRPAWSTCCTRRPAWPRCACYGVRGSRCCCRRGRHAAANPHSTRDIAMMHWRWHARSSTVSRARSPSWCPPGPVAA